MVRTTSTTLILLLLVALSGACMEHTRCDDRVVSQVKSPDGKYVAIVYHRSCAGGSGRYTCARIEEVPPHFWSSAGEPGYVMAIREFHPVSASWRDATHVEISTPGLQQQDPAELAAFPPKNSWAGISVTYK